MSMKYEELKDKFVGVSKYYLGGEEHDNNEMNKKKIKANFKMIILINDIYQLIIKKNIQLLTRISMFLQLKQRFNYEVLNFEN